MVELLEITCDSFEELVLEKVISENTIFKYNILIYFIKFINIFKNIR